jgi:hypothetical protein
MISLPWYIFPLAAVVFSGLGFSGGVLLITSKFDVYRKNKGGE